MAGLSFGTIGKREQDLLTSGPQFEQENAKTILYTQAVGGAVETAYTVPQGKTYHISKIILSNIKTSASTFVFYLNDNATEQPFSAKGPKEFDWYTAPFALKGGQTIKIKSNGDTDTIKVTGWLV